MGLTCRACHTALPPASKFCNACGVRVAEAAAAVDQGRDPRSYTRDLAESMAHWRAVRALLSRAGEAAETAPQALEACTAILGLAWLVGLPPDKAAAVFDAGTALAARAGDTCAQARLVAQYAGVRAGYGEVDEYLRLSQDAVRIAAATDDAALQATVRIPLVRSHLVAGRLREALALAEEALACTPADPEFGNLLGYSPYLAGQPRCCGSERGVGAGGMIGRIRFSAWVRETRGAV